MLETTIQYVITIRYNFLQKYLLYFRPCICIHRFADISFAASYRRYRVIRRRIYDIVKPRYLAFGIAKGLTITIQKRSRNLKKKKWFIDREIINENITAGRMFGLASMLPTNRNILFKSCRLMNEKRSATFKAILHAAGGATIAQRFRERGGQGGLEERERAEEEERKR